MNLLKKMAFFTFLILLCSCGRKTSDIISSARNDSPNQEISSKSTTIQWGSHGGNALANNVVTGQLPNQLNNFGTYNKSGGPCMRHPSYIQITIQIKSYSHYLQRTMSYHCIKSPHPPTVAYTDTTSIEIPGLSTDEQHYKAHQLALGNHNDQLALYITDLSNGLTKINAVNGNVIETKK